MTKEKTNLVPGDMESINDVIGNAPGWLLHSAITIMAVIVAVVLGLISLIKYPDKIVAPGTLTSENPPVVHFANTAGIIEELFISNAQYVQEGDTLAYIKNIMNTEHLQEFTSYLSVLKDAINTKQFNNLPKPKDYNLGDLSQSYGRLKFSIEDLFLTISQTEVYAQIKTLNEEIKETKKLHGLLAEDKEFSKKELALMEKDFERNLTLNEAGIISDNQREQIESNLIQTQRSFNGLDKGMIQNRIREKQLEFEVQRLAESRSSEIRTHLSNISELINVLDQGIRNWEETYIVKAKSTGLVALKTGITEDMQIGTSTPLLTVIKNDEVNVKYAKLICSSSGYGKINKKDRVIMRVEAFPYKEYGVLEGRIDDISELPERDSDGNSVYELRVNLDIPLMTSYNIEIPFNQETVVLGEVITDDLTILSRLFFQFRSILKNT